MICSSCLPKELLVLPLSSDFQPWASRGIQLHLPASAANQFRDFYDHSTGEMYQFPLLQAQGMKIAGSAHGWLITTAGKGGTLHLLNPLTGTEIVLPLTTAFQNVSMGIFMLTPKDTRDLFMVKATYYPIECNGDYIVAATHIADDNWVLSIN